MVACSDTDTMFTDNCLILNTKLKLENAIFWSQNVRRVFNNCCNWAACDKFSEKKSNLLNQQVCKFQKTNNLQNIPNNLHSKLGECKAYYKF